MSNLRIWASVLVICLAAGCADFLVSPATSRGLEPGIFTAFGLVFLLSGLLGVIGSRTRDWRVLVIGSCGIVFAVHVGAYLNAIVSKRVPMRPIVPQADDIVPFLISAGAVLAVAAATNAIATSLRQPPRRGFCKQCGYNLTGKESGICSECGTKTGESEPGPKMGR